MKFKGLFLLFVIVVWAVPEELLMPGGKIPASQTAKDVQNAADFALMLINSKSNSINPHSLVRVKKAETQVVAGTNYHLSLDIEVNGNVQTHNVVVYEDLHSRKHLLDHKISFE
eukprot:gnl/Trimastix_PCT/2445.p3 GENE.gnl/Trimastix_PCT/2445~~gnl/Trimastix_PCT/2445.p3  ORF type:complete len:123 (-),score=19.98 gnl/Trimastix_PCT/2445:467-808(-)